MAEEKKRSKYVNYIRKPLAKGIFQLAVCLVWVDLWDPGNVGKREKLYPGKIVRDPGWLNDFSLGDYVDCRAAHGVKQSGFSVQADAVEEGMRRWMFGSFGRMTTRG